MSVWLQLSCDASQAATILSMPYQSYPDFPFLPVRVRLTCDVKQSRADFNLDPSPVTTILSMPYQSHPDFLAHQSRLCFLCQQAQQNKPFAITFNTFLFCTFV